jgi:hypothetical protein
MVEWSRGLEAEHVKEDKIFYIYKNIIDGDGIQVAGQYVDYTINAIMGMVSGGEIRDRLDNSITEIKPSLDLYGITSFLPKTYDFKALTLQMPFIDLPYMTE